MVDRSEFRDVYHYRLAVVSEVLAAPLRLAARLASRSGTQPPASWRSGIILGQGHIGDVLYRTCSLAALHAGLPACRWSYLAPPGAAAVLAGNPALVEVLPWSSDAAPLAITAERRDALKTRQFDVALCSDNIAHHHALLLALKLRIPNRVALARKGISGLATLDVDTGGPVSHPAAFRQIVDAVTGEHDASELRPRIYPSYADVQAAALEWSRLGLDSSTVVIASAVTTRQTIGDFPPEFFQAVLRRVLTLAPDVRVLLSGSVDDKPVLQAIAANLGDRSVVSAGELSLLAYGAMLRRCSAFVGADSGPRHLANSAGIPVFFVRNMGANEIGSGAYCPSETDLAPAGQYFSPEQMRAALETIDRDAAATAIVSAARRRARDSIADTPR
ncbi:MAG: glycosyltransferase family 9 protein [Gemmatimonadaceae bacterium]